MKPSKAGKKGQEVKPAVVSLLDATFPEWHDQQVLEKDGPEKYEDIAGTAFPQHTKEYLDTWKRPEELVQGYPNIPIVILKQAAPNPDAKEKGPSKHAVIPASRDVEGRLWSGHKDFEWLQAVFTAVMAARKSLPPGDFLWELIHPRDPKEGTHIKPACGKYRIKLFIMDKWRTVVVDDRVPVDLFGRALVVGIRPLQLWPLLLSKAVLKLMDAMRLLQFRLPHQVSAFQALTGWPHEDLLDPLAGPSLAGGACFNRLEEAVQGNEEAEERNAIATICLRKRAIPARAPPRIIVFTGPGAVGRSTLMRRLVEEYGDKFGLTVSTTSRRPREHEVHGVHYYFTTKAAMRAQQAAGEYLEIAPVELLYRGRPLPARRQRSKQRAGKGGPLSEAGAGPLDGPLLEGDEDEGEELGRGEGPEDEDTEVYLYGTSIANVRSVAATGKLCVMGVDEQGVSQLQANKRIDGLYIYVAPPSLTELAVRIRGRLKEAESTLQLRMEWAKAQIAEATKPGAYNHILQNTQFPVVYHGLKEAISTLSPIIRNRLRGLPAYVLDYSDLIPPNMVEKPFLKPVIVSGPHTGERRRLVDKLVREFPDVFAFPRMTTTRQPDEHSWYALTGAEAAEHREELAALKQAQDLAELEASDVNQLTQALKTKRASQANGLRASGANVRISSRAPSRAPSRKASRTSLSTAASTTPSSPTAGRSKERGSEECVLPNVEDEDVLFPVEYPTPIALTDAEFDAAVAEGRLLEHHRELFVHSLDTHRMGVTKEAIKEVIMTGRLPLLELEVESTNMLKDANIDCLSIFLAPISLDEYNKRLRAWLTESDDEVAARIEAASRQLEAARKRVGKKKVEGGGIVFDHILVNEEIESAYAELKGVIGNFRPDIILPQQEQAEVDAEAEKEAEARAKQPVLVLVSPVGGQNLVSALLAQYPESFAVPARITDKKASKADFALPEGVTAVPPKEFAKLATEGQLAFSRQFEPPVGKDPGSSIAVTQAAMEVVRESGKVAVIEVPHALAPTLLPSLRTGALTQGGLYILAASSTLASELMGLDPNPPSLSEASLAEAAASASKSGVYDLVDVEANNVEEFLSYVRAALSEHVPHIVRPPHKPLVVAGPFGTKKRVLLQQLFEQLPGCFVAPAITTTRETPHPEVDDRREMVVVSQAEAARLVDSDGFLVHSTVLGHTYGITRASLARAQATGQVAVIELDYVEDAKALRAEDFEAVYIYLGVDSMDVLLKRVHEEVMSNPPLGYEPQEAATRFFDKAKAEVAASRQEGLFDAWVDNDQNAAASFGRLAEAVHKHFPTVVPAHFVYGFGRGLWDPSMRCHGQHSLKVMVLGPAGAGKTTVCVELAARFALPHINVGDLLYKEVAEGTPLGLEAKVYIEQSKTVLDKHLLEVLHKRLQQEDCQANGWLLDGFPHTAEQAAALEGMGIQPDKVVFLGAENAVLMDRTRHRRIDPVTEKVYQLGGPDALSARITPVTREGVLDKEVVARLQPRHDDSEENVLHRLELWDKHEASLRAAYEDVTLRVEAGTKELPNAVIEQAAQFLALESHISDLEVVESHKLKEHQYEIINTLRYKRRQLLRLWQDDGRLFWVDIKEAARNAHCMLLSHNPAKFGAAYPPQMLRRADTATVARSAALLVDSPEPSRMLISLTLGPQLPLQAETEVPHTVLMLCGPKGVGKQSLVSLLEADYADRVRLVQLLTTKPCYKGEEEGHLAWVTTHAALAKMRATPGVLAGDCIVVYDGHEYALPTEPLHEAWAAGLLPVLQGPMALAQALRAVMQPIQREMLQAKMEAAAAAAAAAAAPPQRPGANIGVGAGPDRLSSRASTMGTMSLVPSQLADSQPHKLPRAYVEVACVYMMAGVATRDVRLREREGGPLEEQDLQHELQLGEAESAQVVAAYQVWVKEREARYEAAQQKLIQAQQPRSLPAVGGAAGLRAAAEAEAEAQAALQAATQEVADCKVPPLGVPDHVIKNNEKDPLLLVHAQVTEVAASMWHPPRAAMPCPLVLEDLACWQAGPMPTRLRLRALTSTGAMLDLPRGRHLLRATVPPDFAHALMVYTMPPAHHSTLFKCMAGELSKVVAEAGLAPPALHLLQPVVQPPQMMRAEGEGGHGGSGGGGGGDSKPHKGDKAHKEGKGDREGRERDTSTGEVGGGGGGGGGISPGPWVGIGLGDADLPVVTNFSGEYLAPLAVGSAAVLLRINLVAADAEALQRLAGGGAGAAAEGGVAGATPRLPGQAPPAPAGKPTLPNPTAFGAATAKSFAPPPPAPSAAAMAAAAAPPPLTRVSATLSVSGEEVRAATRLLLLDNATGKEVGCAPSGRLQPCSLEPHAAGYTLLALAVAPQGAGIATVPASDRGPSPRRGAVAGAPASGAAGGAGGPGRGPAGAGGLPGGPDTPGAGTWFLQLISDHPLASATEAPVGKPQLAGGLYTANARCILTRQVITPSLPVQVSLLAATHPGLPLRLRVSKVPSGELVMWDQEYPVQAECSGGAGQVLLPNLNLVAGKYLVQMELRREDCPEGWQPDPITGAIHLSPEEAAAAAAAATAAAAAAAAAPPPPRGASPAEKSRSGGSGGAACLSAQPVSLTRLLPKSGRGRQAAEVGPERELQWRLSMLPTADERVCPLTTDDSQVRHFRALQDSWGGIALHASQARAAPKQGAAKSSGAPAGGARAQQAAQLLDKLLEELAEEEEAAKAALNCAANASSLEGRRPVSRSISPKKQPTPPSTPPAASSRYSRQASRVQQQLQLQSSLAPKRFLKDGTQVDLEPSAHMQRIQPPLPPAGSAEVDADTVNRAGMSRTSTGRSRGEEGGVDAAGQEPAGVLAQAARVAALEQAIASTSHLSTVISGSILAEDKQHRGSLIATKTGEFARWRAQAQAQAQERVRVRLEALSVAKEEAAAAAAAEASAKRPSSGPSAAPVPVK